MKIDLKTSDLSSMAWMDRLLPIEVAGLTHLEEPEGSAAVKTPVDIGLYVTEVVQNGGWF